MKMIFTCTFSGEVIESNGGSKFKWATELEERNKLWKARHNAWYADMALRPGCKVHDTELSFSFSLSNSNVPH